MNVARKFLLATTAGLAILFSGCSARNTAIASTPADQAATLTTVMQDYNTAASDQLKRLSVDFNKGRPAGTQPIVYMDYDQVVTWAQLQKTPDIEKAIGDYLTAKTGKTFDAATIDKIFNAMNAQKPAAITPAEGVQGACIVVPEYPGSSFDSYYKAGFQVGDKLLLKDKVVTLNLSTLEFSAFANAHETWHCFDNRYRDDVGEGLAGAVKNNRAEMFADIGGAMERIKEGADLSLIDKIAAERTTWVFLTGPARAHMQDDDSERYMSIVYNTQPGLYALKSRIEEMGLDNFRKLDREQMRALDYEITDAHALTLMQASGLQAYYATGHAPAALQADIAKMKDVSDASVRNATPKEIAQAKQNAMSAGGGKGIDQMLRDRAAALGDASSLANQLQARKELTDSLRKELVKSPATEAATQAQLDTLFLSNPRLPPAGK